MPPAKKPKKAVDTTWAPKSAKGAALARFEDQFAHEMGVSLATTNDEYEVVSTGSLNLDMALGIGGLPTGRIAEMWGPEHAGKTSLAMLTAAEYQRRYPDKKVAWADIEQTFDPKWAAALGVDVEAMWRPPVKTAEEGADFVKKFVTSGFCSLVVLDSIGAMISKKEFEKDAEDDTVALVAKVVTRMVKQCSPAAKSNGTTVLVINQVRAGNVGGGYGPDQDTTGGWALKHISSIKIRVRRGGSPPKTVTFEGQPVPVGYEVSCQIQKNKLAPYGKVANFWLFNIETDRYGPVGVDIVTETFDYAKRLGLLGTGGGGNYQVPGVDQKFKGEDKVVDYLREHRDVVHELRGQVLASIANSIKDETPEGFNPDDPLGIAASLPKAAS